MRGRQATLGIALAAAGCAAAVLAPAAEASIVGASGTVTAGAGEVNNIVVTRTAAGGFTVTDTAGATTMPSAVCTQDSATQVTCISPVQSVFVFPSDLNDTVNLVGVGGQVAGGAGDDVLDGSRAAGAGLSLSGQAGNDTVTGGPSSDQLDSQPVLMPGQSPASAASDPPDAGDDKLVGNGGDDYLNVARGADTAEAGDGNDLVQGSVVPYTFPTAPGLTPTDDAAVDSISCGEGSDSAQVFVGDVLGADCEIVAQFLTCPSGVDCVGTATATAGGGASASALAAGGKGKTGKGKVLGKSRKVKVRGGQTTAVMIPLRAKQVNGALGKSPQVSAAILLELQKMKGKRTVGRVKRRVRFKLKR